MIFFYFVAIINILILTRFALNKLILFFTVFIFTSSCGKLQVDESVAYQLATISTSSTPALEDIRNFAQLGDLIYTAAGSGGILVYRIVGDVMDPVLELSLTNLYSEELEEVYVRTIEILQTESQTNLIFSYDTLFGGGVGVAEISTFNTKPLGSLKTEPNLRIKHTSTTLNPNGIYHVLVASENVGLISYDLSFISNSYFEMPIIASLVDYVSLMDIERPAQQFMALSSPESLKITNISQITNLEILVQLALDNPTLFSSMISNIPFISEQQRSQIQQILSITNQPFVSNVIDVAKDSVGKEVLNQVLENPQSLESLLNSSALSGSVPEALAKSGMTNIDRADQIQSNISPSLVTQAQQIVENNTIEQADVQNVLSLSGLQQVVQNTLATRPTTFQIPNTNIETETLFEESMLSNLNLAGEIDTKLVHNRDFNPFINRREIGNAGLEIQRTVDSLGRRFFVEENENLKNQLLTLGEDELKSIFVSVFQQADTTMSFIPLLESAGVNVRELYQYWVDGDYQSILNNIDTSVVAELLRRLPRYQVKTEFQVRETNISLSRINNIHSDLNTMYIATGDEGVLIVDRLSWKVIDSIKKSFSDTMMVRPYSVFGRDIYIVVDKLDGLILYKRNKNKTIGEQIARVTLVGEASHAFPFEDVMWVADGSNGVLAVRINDDFSLTIEAELYQKEGIAYYIGTARRREVLASYGADGLKRLRITNTISEGSTIVGLDQEVKQQNSEDFIDRLLLWSRTSNFAQFLRRLFLS